MSLLNYNPENWVIKRADGNTILIRDAYGTVCSITHPHHDDKADADAGYIAKVPDMIEALKEAKRMYEEVQPAGGWQGVYEQICDALNQ